MTEAEILRKGIEDFLAGNYADPRSYRGTTRKCPHGQFYYEDCGECSEAHFVRVLREASETVSCENTVETAPA